MAADNQKLYQNIIAALQADIAEGRFRVGDRLPPERVLVERFQVSRLTIREAMIGMEILGLVAARRGSGVYVTAPPADGPILGLGDRGPAVAELKQRFRNFGYGLGESNEFDGEMEAVVRAFQRHFRPARIDGIADPSTVKTLDRVLAAMRRK